MITASKTFYYEPNTSIWLSELSRVNSKQYHHARTMIQLSGTCQCCSMCGTTHQEQEDKYGYVNARVRDYKVLNADIATARFCEDCRRLQHSMFQLVTEVIPDGFRYDG